MPKTVVGLFDHAADAHAARDELTDLGFNITDMNLVPTDPRHSDYLPIPPITPPPSSRAAADTGAGAATGAFIGAFLGLLASFGLLKILAITTVLAIGPIIGVVVGGIFGAAVGSLFGGIIAMRGQPPRHQPIQSDSALLSVITDDDRAERAVEILSSHNAIDIDRRASDWEGLNSKPIEWPNPSTPTLADIEKRARAPEPRHPENPADALPITTPNESIYQDPTRSPTARLYHP